MHGKGTSNYPYSPEEGMQNGKAKKKTTMWNYFRIFLFVFFYCLPFNGIYGRIIVSLDSILFIDYCDMDWRNCIQ